MVLGSRAQGITSQVNAVDSIAVTIAVGDVIVVAVAVAAVAVAAVAVAAVAVAAVIDVQCII